MRKIILVFLLSLALVDCKSNYRIDENDFVNLYADLLIAKEIYRGNDSGYIKARDSIYTVYNVNNFMVEKNFRVL